MVLVVIFLVLAHGLKELQQDYGVWAGLGFQNSRDFTDFKSDFVRVVQDFKTVDDPLVTP